MKKNKFPFSVAIFTLLTVFVFPLFMSMVSSQPLLIRRQGNWWHHQITELRKKEVEKKRIEAEKKREAARKTKLKRIKKEKEETNTLVAFSKSTSFSNHKKRYWLSPILLGLKEITDKNGKTYKLDKIAKALKEITTKKYWDATTTIPWHYHGSETDLLHPYYHFFDIKGEGRKQLLSLLEKGTDKPLGIITNIKQKITEYQIKFFESVRPDLIKLKNSIWSANSSPVLKVSAGVQEFDLHYLMKTKNLKTVSYKNLDKWTKSQLIGISMRANGLEGGVQAFHDGVTTALKLSFQAFHKALKKKEMQRITTSVNDWKNKFQQATKNLQLSLQPLPNQELSAKTEEKSVGIVKTPPTIKPVLADNKKKIKVIGSNYQIDSLSEEASLEWINSKTLFDNLIKNQQIPFSKNINNNKYQINKTEIKEKNLNPENFLPKTTFSFDKDKLKKSNSTSRDLQEHTFSLDKNKLKEPLLQTKEIQIQPKITSVKNSLPKKTLNNKKIKQTSQTPSKVTLTENWKSKSVKKHQSTTLQNKREKTRLIIAFLVTGGVLSLSALGGGFYWFLKNKKIFFSLPCLQNQE